MDKQPLIVLQRQIACGQANMLFDGNLRHRVMFLAFLYFGQAKHPPSQQAQWQDLLVEAR
ncbi:hypothetical protein D3C75_1051620 [compost metagenome]